MARLQCYLFLTAALALLCPAPLAAKDREKEARQIVDRLDQGDTGWNVRMEALVRLARLGPAAAPVLAEALHKGSPTTRELAAQALGLLAEPSTRPALERALGDPKSGVRLYAIQALSVLGKLPRTEQ